MSSNDTTKRVYASGTVFYNDCKSLERTLNSLKDKVDIMICVDGRYKHFVDGNDKGLSTDGSRELVKSYDNAKLIDLPNTFEIEKRQAYLDVCAHWIYGVTKDDYRFDKIDYLLIIDSDEYVLEWEPTTFRGNCLSVCETEPYKQYNVFAVMCEINQDNYNHIVHQITGSSPPSINKSPEKQFAHQPRLWHRPYEMMYNVTHYNFINKDPATGSLHNCETNAAVAIIPGLKIGHDHLLRTPEFLDKRYGYQKHLVEFEQKKLRQYMQKHKQKPPLEIYDRIDAEPVDNSL